MLVWHEKMVQVRVLLEPRMDTQHAGAFSDRYAPHTDIEGRDEVTVHLRRNKVPFETVRYGPKC
jgi:hypothetical protein